MRHVFTPSAVCYWSGSLWRVSEWLSWLWPALREVFYCCLHSSPPSIHTEHTTSVPLLNDNHLCYTGTEPAAHLHIWTQIMLQTFFMTLSHDMNHHSEKTRRQTECTSHNNIRWASAEHKPGDINSNIILTGDDEHTKQLIQNGGKKLHHHMSLHSMKTLKRERAHEVTCYTVLCDDRSHLQTDLEVFDQLSSWLARGFNAVTVMKEVVQMLILSRKNQIHLWYTVIQM